MQVKDKVVIVTGGVGEIGKVIALTLAKRGSNLLKLILAKRRFVESRYVKQSYNRFGIPEVHIAETPEEYQKIGKVCMSNKNRFNLEGRLGRPEEAGGTVIYLASDASDFITSHTLLIDGGYTVW